MGGGAAGGVEASACRQLRPQVASQAAARRCRAGMGGGAGAAAAACALRSGPQWHAKQAGCCARLHRCPQLSGMSAERSGAALFPWLEHVAVCRPLPSTARTRGGRAAAAYVDYASCGIVNPAGRQQSGWLFAREKGEAKGTHGGGKSSCGSSSWGRAAPGTSQRAGFDGGMPRSAATRGRDLRIPGCHGLGRAGEQARALPWHPHALHRSPLLQHRNTHGCAWHSAAPAKSSASTAARIVCCFPGLQKAGGRGRERRAA